MKNSAYKRYIVWGVTVFSVIALAIVLFFGFYRAKDLGGAIRVFISILKPFIYGAALAYVLNPLYSFCEKLLIKPFTRCFKKPAPAFFLAHFFSTLIILILTVISIFGLLYLIIPQITGSIFGIVEKMPNYLLNLRTWADQLMDDSTYVGPLLINTYQSISTYIENWLRVDLMPLLATWAVRASSSLLSAVTMLFNLLIGIVVMIYLLNGKRIFAAQGKKMLYSILGVARSNAVIESIRYAHRVFGGFINGKLLTSLCVGIICFIFMIITKMPYALLISVIIGITNIIPFFGPIIGAIPSILLLLFENPLLCLYFLIFILILQLVDGNIIGPRILGQTTGLPSFWVLFSILFFGRLFGFLGMVLGVPVFALIYSLTKALIKRGLTRRGLPVDTENYNDLHHIDDESKTAVKNSANRG